MFILSYKGKIFIDFYMYFTKAILRLTKFFLYFSSTYADNSVFQCSWCCWMCDRLERHMVFKSLIIHKFFTVAAVNAGALKSIFEFIYLFIRSVFIYDGALYVVSKRSCRVETRCWVWVTWLQQVLGCVTSTFDQWVHRDLVYKAVAILGSLHSYSRFISLFITTDPSKCIDC